MIVEYISVGTEILLGNIINTNAAFLAEQFAKLKYEKKNGCEYLQGFYFSRPLPQAEFVKFLTM